MSSSVFMETSSSIPKQSEALGEQGDDIEPLASKADSNLVVVYSKNGVNFDRKGLENLIEEKTLASISVIRLTSPTPSMEHEEEEVEKLEEMLRRQDINSEEEPETQSDDDTGTENDGRNKKSGSDNDGAESPEDTSEDSFNESESNTTDAEKCLETTRSRKKKKERSSNVKAQKARRKTKKDRPEIVGLTVEEFYPPKDAKELAKEILRMAGIPTVKQTADHKLQMYVIKNDHCYTPFTSPTQMRDKKAAEKIEAEKQLVATRKLIPHSSTSAKQIFTKKKLYETEEEKKPSTNASVHKINKDRQKLNSNELADNEGENNSDEVNEETEFDEESDFSDSETSAETDNDRDSDLDFNLNNRKGRKRKVKLLKKSKRIHSASKTQNRRQQNSQDDSNEAKTPPPPQLNPQRTKPSGSSYSETGRMNKTLPTQIIKVQGNSIGASVLSKSFSNSNAVFPPIHKKPTPFVESKQPSSLVQQTIISNAVRRGPIVQIRRHVAIHSDQVQSAPQTVKEIVINKVMASPKGGFTDISALLTKAGNSVLATPTTPTSSTRPISHSTPSSKGFTPLGIESAAKNQLPAQISVQTHQSTSELAAEHDKQLDLIDSIVQDEMQKSGIIEKVQSANENIPELVKMLESTEKALESNKKSKTQIENFTPRNAVDDIDISNATLLNVSEDEIPDDLLQHVVELIEEEDKSLKEAVHKQVFCSEIDDTISPAIAIAATPAVMPLKQQPPLGNVLQQLSDNENASKSIIQLTLSSETVSPVVDNQLATAHPIHIEPIKIVRGNGRVITLPPIEAPTTRAKRRAQGQPAHEIGANASSFLNDSLDNSMQSNTSFSYTDIISAEKTPTVCDDKMEVSKEDCKTPSTGNSKSAKKASSGRKAQLNKTAANVSQTKVEISKSREDDDDPNKLWCICRQPHNNRFMICCDVCEDWFHGTCVSITKAMGLEMEQKGIDWTCPKCVKKLEEKKQRKITDMLIAKKTQPTVSVELKKDEQQLSQQDIQQQLQNRKQHIEIKKIQSGQFISLKSLENSKKFPVTVVTSGQKKLYAASPNLKSGALMSATTQQGKRIVIQNVHAIQKSKTANVTKLQHQSSITTAEEVLNPCIMCKKPARHNTIYCSDDCIRKYASSYLAKSPDVVSEQIKVPLDDKKKKGKGLFEDLLSMADRKPKAERVNVFERKSGRLLIGSSAPTTLNLKKWLQDNPTYEVVQPGSVQAIELEKRQKQRPLNSSFSTVTVVQSQPDSPASSHHTLSPTPSTSMKIVSTGTSRSEELLKIEILPFPKSVKQLVEQSKQSSSSRPTTPKQVAKNFIKMTKPDSKEKLVKRVSNENDNKRAGESGTDPVRVSVRRTLKDQLVQRIEEQKNMTDTTKTDDSPPLLNADEIEKFVKETESEMFNYFNRDAGTKYKAKYRSLMFNIKDRKNHTLFAKICAKVVDPKQLVHMSAEELASQELAQWREKEAKHQLEMIKKSELDMLSCTKNYVLKTHKGEEVIEDKTIDQLNLDITTPVEDVVLLLNNVTGESGDNFDNIAPSPRKEPSYNLDSSSYGQTLSSSADEKSKGDKHKTSKDRIRRSADRDRRHKSRERERERDRHREKTRYRKRSRSQSRSRTRSKEKKHKSMNKDGRRDKEERDRDKDKDDRRDKEERDRDKDKETKFMRDKEKMKDKESKEDLSKKNLLKKNVNETIKENHRNESDSNVLKKQQISKPIQHFSLIDQILESSKTIEEAANLIPETESSKSKDSNKITTTHKSMPSVQPSKKTSVSLFSTPLISTSMRQESCDSDSERNLDSRASSDPYFPFFDPNSIFSQNTLWEGNINMIDLSSFQILLQPVMGNCINIGKFMRTELDVVGRIGPDTVLDYVSKIKRSPNKEIVIVRLVPADTSETAAYTILYDYLYERKRMGVIKTTSLQIKDFYIFPLRAQAQMPTILQPLERVSFLEDLNRPNILLGIVIRVIGKRVSVAPNISSSLQFSVERDSFTTPGSPKRKKRSKKEDIDAIIKAPISGKINKPTAPPVDDADEPYSPGGGSSDDDVPSLPIISAVTLGPIQSSEDELKRKMDEINRKIAAQEMEIAGILNNEQSRYCPSHSSSAKVLANISIPSNLSQILASIKKKAPEATDSLPPPSMGSQSIITEPDEEYNPEATSYNSRPYNTGSKLKNLTEAELLSMVPDDMIEQHTADKLSRCDEPPPPGV